MIERRSLLAASSSRGRSRCVGNSLCAEQQVEPRRRRRARARRGEGVCCGRSSAGEGKAGNKKERNVNLETQEACVDVCFDLGTFGTVWQLASFARVCLMMGSDVPCTLLCSQRLGQGREYKRYIKMGKGGRGRGEILCAVCARRGKVVSCRQGGCPDTQSPRYQIRKGTSRRGTYWRSLGWLAVE